MNCVWMAIIKLKTIRRRKNTHAQRDRLQSIKLFFAALSMHTIGDISILFQNTHTISNESNGNVMCSNRAKWNVYSARLEVIQTQRMIFTCFWLKVKEQTKPNEWYLQFQSIVFDSNKIPDEKLTLNKRTDSLAKLKNKTKTTKKYQLPTTMKNQRSFHNRRVEWTKRIAYTLNSVRHVYAHVICKPFCFFVRTRLFIYSNVNKNAKQRNSTWRRQKEKKTTTIMAHRKCTQKLTIRLLIKYIFSVFNGLTAVRVDQFFRSFRLAFPLSEDRP